MTVTTVTSFNLTHADTSSVFFEQDHDLVAHTKAARRGGDVAAIVFVELRLDGCDINQVRVAASGPINPGPDEPQYHPFNDDTRILSDAIDSLTAVRDRLVKMVDPQTDGIE